MDTSDKKLGAEYALENAKKQFEAAELIAEKKNYGLACSLMVLSAEEALKAFALFGDDFLPDYSGIDFTELFSSHNYKLNLIRSAIGLRTIVQTLNKNINEPVIENIEKPIDEIIEIRSKGIDNFVNWVENEISSKKTELSSQLGWWKQAEALKEDGFYIKYNNQGWHSPLKIKRARYDKTKKYVKDFIDMIVLITTVDFEIEPVASIFNDIKQRFNNLKKKYDNKG
ncbi:MAG TPA: hypothetical protein DDX39_11990 [Bacteroidales bacterium]|nr:MAG: hypothetical protein A2W98_10365 [Bacteroidetes bacterium GWF2_33_38]HBF89352.1 hypothetical protein [Bacteroidales bacterium]